MEVTCIPAVEQRAESILRQIQSLDEGYLQISSPGIDWFFYGRAGQLVYISNSIDPFERLARAIRARLQGSGIDSQDLSLQVRAQYEQIIEAQEEQRQSSPAQTTILQADYQLLAELAVSGQLPAAQLSAIIQQINLEVLESFCLLPEEQLKLQPVAMAPLPALGAIDLLALCRQAEQRLQQWQAFQPEFYSPYQRPYLTGAPLSRSNFTPELQARLRQVLIGFSFRQIAMLLGQDELVLAEQFLPLVQQGMIKLHDPFAPFDLLPWKPASGQSASRQSASGQSAIAPQPAPQPPAPSQPVTPPSPATPNTAPSESFSARIPQPSSGGIPVSVQPQITHPPLPSQTAPPASTKTWKIVCIDDSPAVLNEINRFLQSDLFGVTLIDDSKKALMKINSIRPDLILLDANMPGVDGYQVCTMLRKSSTLKHIPVIMVTGNRGLVNRAKAKLAGITDYLNKPFSQKELLEIIFRHLSQ